MNTYNPIESGEGGDRSGGSFQVGQTLHEAVFDRLPTVQDPVGEPVLAEFVPDLFHGFSWGAAGRQSHQTHARRNPPLVGEVSAGPIQDPQQELVGVAASDFPQEPTQGLGVRIPKPIPEKGVARLRAPLQKAKTKSEYQRVQRLELRARGVPS